LTYEDHGENEETISLRVAGSWSLWFILFGSRSESNQINQNN